MNEVPLRRSGGRISPVPAEKTAKSADQERKSGPCHAPKRSKFNGLQDEFRYWAEQPNLYARTAEKIG
jgi:hypothetical protein